MIVVRNQLYSFHASQVPGFDRIFELARQHSCVPAGFDERHFEDLPAEHRLFARRLTLDHPPNEAVILQQEYELAATQKGDHSTASVARDVETEANRRALDALPPLPPGREPAKRKPPRDSELPRRVLKHRVASGYVKLDERKTRLQELTAEVSTFFGVSCRCQGDYWYPRGGFRDWHTNKYDASGWRLYIVDVDAPEQSYFRVKNPTTGKLETLWDRPGTFNFFRIDPENVLWHCIGAPHANRWSKGFVVPETWLDRVAARL